MDDAHVEITGNLSPTDSSKQEHERTSLWFCATLQCTQEGLLWGPDDKASHENSLFNFSSSEDNPVEGISCRQKLARICNSPCLCAPLKACKSKQNKEIYSNNTNILTLPAPKTRALMDTYSYNAVPRTVTSTYWYIYILGNPE